MSEVLGSFVSQFGVGGIGGFLVGYAAKKVLKILGLFLGLSLLALLYLDYAGLISVNYEGIVEAVAGMLQGVTQILPAIVSQLPLASSFVAGMTLGVMKG